MDLNAWFQWLFPSPGHFLLAFGGLIVLLGFIGGLTDSRRVAEAGDWPRDLVDKASGNPWWKREEDPYRDWNAHQVSEQHRTARRHSAMD